MASSVIRRVVPLFDRVLVERLVPVTRTSSGILLPETTKKINEGTVVAVGGGARDRDGKLVPMSLKSGDRVLLPEFGGTNVKVEDKDYVMYREDDILGKLE